ncbi:MAG: cytochrome P450 [Acidimicrobiales bacterium]
MTDEATAERTPRFDYDFHGSPLDTIFDDYETMHRECPVSWSDRYGGFWTLTKYDDVHTAEHDSDTFSVAPSMILPSFGTDRPLIPLDIDPPELTRYRQILLPFFTPSSMDELLPRTHEIARKLLDDVAGQEVFDASEYSRLLPAMVFGEYCGFPMGDAAQFDRWVDDIVFARADDELVARSAANDVYSYFRELIALRRRKPGSDVISALLAADHGGPLNDEEMLDICYLLFVAGLETTAGTIRVALWYLAQHPDELALLVADPSLIPKATEEFLRALSPVQAMARTLKCDTEFGDVAMRKGERVVVAFGAANRDPDVFECPQEIRLDRQSNPHMAFGTGAHRCLGSNLARREVNVGIEEFVSRYPRFELAEPTTWHGVGRLAIRPLR